MAARAMWKGVVRFGAVRVGVKLFSALEDRSVRFRLLDRQTRHPVSQSLVDPESGEVVPYEATRRALVTDGDDMVVFEPEELERLRSEPSRDIEVKTFVPSAAIDPRWYDRPYYLGPDGDERAYAALVRALERTSLEGIAGWTMRNKDYVGALRPYRGYPMLVTLRHEEDVIPVERVERPAAAPIDDRQLEMARQLLGMLEAPFDPDDYRDEYRERVLELIERKRDGQSAPAKKRRSKRPARDLDRALEASLRGGGARA